VFVSYPIEVVMSHSVFQRICALVISVAMLGLAGPSVSYAGIIDTATAIEASSQRDADLAAVRAGLDRQDVRDRFVALGVDPQSVDARLAVLSDSELNSLAGRMEQLPAGGDALALVGAVFLILLILEVVGVIDIFKKT